MNQSDPFAELKTRQREMWASVTPTAIFTTSVAGQLAKFAGMARIRMSMTCGQAQKCWRSSPRPLVRKSRALRPHALPAQLGARECTHRAHARDRLDRR
jgi:hypothetical protein